MDERLNTIILIPSLNPNDSVLRLVKELKQLGLNNQIIINDGSDSSCLSIFDDLKNLYGCTVISHEKNEGKGAALKTGIEAIKNIFPGAVGIITADADGQHSPNDILRISEALNNNPSSFILGARNFDTENVPFKSKFGNKITSFVLFLLTGKKFKDTQTGLRGIPLHFSDKLLKIKGKRFEYETNVIIDLTKEKADFIEIPINTIYENDNRETHFRPIKDSLLIYFQIIKFLVSSFLSFIIDISLFSLFYSTVFSAFNEGIIYSTITARFLSGIFNYTLNKTAVFKVNEKNLSYFIKYILLFFSIMILSSVSLSIFASLSEINVTLLKIMVDTVLFIISFTVQKLFIFKK